MNAKKDDGVDVTVHAQSKAFVAIAVALASLLTGGVMSAPQWLSRQPHPVVSAQSPDANEVSHQSMQRQIDRVERALETQGAKLDILLQRAPR